MKSSLYSQLWWAPGRRGVPVSLWATLAHAQRSSGCMGSGTQPGPSPGSQQPYQVAMTTNTFIPVPLSGHGSAFVNNHNWEVGGRDQPQLGWSCEPQAIRDWRVRLKKIRDGERLGSAAQGPPGASSQAAWPHSQGRSFRPGNDLRPRLS